ncbi:MAG: gamma-glutamyl-gamma-aminobutyrate hydrolase family protein [Planctomycetota bacterium]|nr:gamma-glutamyl-gamma-aminobutyrate hydrolase family protein [Planctomycetota bacterium]
MKSSPVIGISCSTLVDREEDAHLRFSLPEYYVQCVLDAGGLPLMLPNIDADHVPAYLSRVDGVVLSGGVDVEPHHFGQEPHPDLGVVDSARDLFELALCRGIRAQGVPTLAICRGIQVMNVAFGGTLFQHIPGQVPGAIRHSQRAIRHSAVDHSILIEEGTHLRELAGTARTRVNTFHHQAIDRLAAGLVVTARATDGVIEGAEDPAHPFLVGVQWHPERRRDDPLTQALFRGLVEAARQTAGAGT